MGEYSLNVSAISLNEVGGVELADVALRSLAEDAGIVVAGDDDDTNGYPCVDMCDCGCPTDLYCVDFGCPTDWWLCS